MTVDIQRKSRGGMAQIGQMRPPPEWSGTGADGRLWVWSYSPRPGRLRKYCVEVFADGTIASAILDRVLHHCTVINIKGESYRLKERREFMRQKQQIVNTLFEQNAQ